MWRDFERQSASKEKYDCGVVVCQILLNSSLRGAEASGPEWNPQSLGYGVEDGKGHTDWLVTGFKKNVNRATTQVMMKTGHVEKTNDRDYEVEERYEYPIVLEIIV